MQGIQKLQTNMHHANNLQNLVRTHRKETNKNNAHRNRKQPVRIQRRSLNGRCSNKGRTIHKKHRENAEIVLVDLSKAFDTINRTLLWTTLYKKGIPEEMIKHIRRGHTGTKLAPKYKRRYEKLNENNIGVSQGSEISPLLSIIYLDDVMEDLGR